MEKENPLEEGKMLELRNITKTYKTGSYDVEALQGVSLSFREQEFVAILGPSGCGKTTMLNIIGGLDNYTSGDLVINGHSTKNYSDKDWDQYRNHSIGFVFQSYNLIPHQNVLQNVDLANQISDVPSSEGKDRSIKALESVGLGDEINKRPNQISGGQSQRVAISRALVTNPDIILADEPTGALDSESSKQVMDIIKELAKDRLVIMVTHDAELAEKYADRIVKMKDGLVISDTNPYSPENTEVKPKKTNKAKMKLLTAFRLSLNNLWAKKGRTILTALAGSIGIIGIALIFALSYGIQNYINDVQEETLSAYPITIEKEAMDATAFIENLAQRNNDDLKANDKNKIYSQNLMFDFMQGMSSTSSISNNMGKFKKFLEKNKDMQEYVSNIHYSYAIDLPVYTRAKDNKIYYVNLMDLMSSAFATDNYQNAMLSQFTLAGEVNLFQELVPDNNGEKFASMYKDQYDLVTGHMPENYNEIVMILDKNNQVADITLYALGMRDRDELSTMMNKILNNEDVDTKKSESEEFSFDDFLNLELKVILPSKTFTKNESNGTWTDVSTTETGKDFLYDSDSSAIPLKVVGIVREKADSQIHGISSAFAYTEALTNYIIENTENTEIVKAQLENPEVDVFNGLPFITGDWEEPNAAKKAEDIQTYAKDKSVEELSEFYTWMATEPDNDSVEQAVSNQLASLSREEIQAQVSATYAEQMKIEAAQVEKFLNEMSDEELFSAVKDVMKEQYVARYKEMATKEVEQIPVEQRAALFKQGEFTEAQWVSLYDKFMPATVSEKSLKENLETLGYRDPEVPETIYIYSKTFEAKDGIADVITSYNEQQEEDDKIQYTDYIALLMSSITAIINGISYVLIAFVAISLIVSSVMIGIITYISVIERTKEIGILRALGASKNNITTVFNVETFVEGLISGVLGILISLALLIPINSLIRNLTGIKEITAAIPVSIGLGLIAISVLLTLIAGAIPARFAAKLDPVDALRVE